MWREGWEGGRLFERGDYCKYFGQRGAIIRGRSSIRGTAIIRENMDLNCRKKPMSKNLLGYNLSVRSALYNNLFTLKFETLILIS